MSSFIPNDPLMHTHAINNVRFSRDDAEVLCARATIADRLRPFVSERFILQEVFGFKESEVRRLLTERSIEAMDLPPLQPISNETNKACARPCEAPKIQEGLGNLADVTVADGGYLVFHVKTEDVQPEHLKEYLTAIKRDVVEVFKDAPFKDRIVCLGGAERPGFSVINPKESEPKNGGQIPLPSSNGRVTTDSSTLSFTANTTSNSADTTGSSNKVVINWNSSGNMHPIRKILPPPTIG